MTYKKRWTPCAPIQLENFLIESQVKLKDPYVRFEMQDQVFVGKLMRIESTGIFTLWTIKTAFGTLVVGGDKPEQNPTSMYVERPDYLELPQWPGAIIRVHSTAYVRLAVNLWKSLGHHNDVTHSDKDLQFYSFKIVFPGIEPIPFDLDEL